MSDPTTNESGRDEARRQAQTLGDDARAAGQDAYRTVRDEAGKQADAAQGRLASEAGNVAEALRKAAEASRDGSPQERTFGQIADTMADVSETIAHKDLGEIMDDASSFARRNPMAFLGGAALLGFAAARFAKASQSPRSSSGDYSTMHSSARPGAGNPMPPRDPVPAVAPNPAGTPAGKDRGIS